MISEEEDDVDRALHLREVVHQRAQLTIGVMRGLEVGGQLRARFLIEVALKAHRLLRVAMRLIRAVRLHADAEHEDRRVTLLELFDQLPREHAV